MSSEATYEEQWASLGIPSNLIVRGDLDLRDIDIERLPSNLVVIGNLIVGESLVALPARLKVGGNLQLTASLLERLPDCLQVGGDLDVSYSKVLDIPSSVRVNGDLIVAGSVVRAAEGMHIGGLIVRGEQNSSGSEKMDAFFSSAGYQPVSVQETVSLAKSFKDFKL